MADFPLVGNRIEVEEFGYDTSTSGGTLVPTTLNGENAWVEMVASTLLDTDSLEFEITSAESNTYALRRMYIGVGAAGFEVKLFNGLMMEGKQPLQNNLVNVPISIPKGSRISFMLDANGATRGLSFGGRLYAGQFKSQNPLHDSITYGISGVDSRRGIQVDCGIIANTKGAWSELEASTSDSINGFILALGHDGDPSHSSANILSDVALGAAGFEVIIAENISNESSTSDALKGMRFIDVAIASGQRISVRSQMTAITNTIISASITGFK